MLQFLRFLTLPDIGYSFTLIQIALLGLFELQKKTLNIINYSVVVIRNIERRHDDLPF